MDAPGRLAALVTLTIALLFPLCARAGIGADISQTTLVDTRSPELDVDALPEHLLLQGGQIFTFNWSCDEAHPGTLATDFLARVVAGETVLEEISWLENQPGYSWEWTAPEVQSPHCRLEVEVRDIMGNLSSHVSTPFTILLSTSGVETPGPVLQLGKPYPNPFNPACSVEFSLPEAGPARVCVFDARGRMVRELWRDAAPVGTSRLEWNGADQSGRPQPAGVYFFVLETPGFPRQVSRATLIP